MSENSNIEPNINVIKHIKGITSEILIYKSSSIKLTNDNSISINKNKFL